MTLGHRLSLIVTSVSAGRRLITQISQAGLSVVILEAVMCIIVHTSITLLTELQQMVMQIHLYINDEGPANDTTNGPVSSWKLFKLYLQILKGDWAYIPRQDPVKGLKVANLS